MKALITGISGFAGSHLAELLIEKGYEVFGTFFDKSTFSNLNDFVNKIKVYRCDIRDYDALKDVIEDVQPDEIYHLAAISFIPTSLKDPKLTFDTNLYGTLNLYQAVIDLEMNPMILFVGSADEYGIVNENDLPIKEECPLNPMNPYSISKTSADFLSFFYFKNYSLNIIRVRPFNHIGPRQSPEFVCSDFAKQIAEIEKGLREPIIKVGNLEAEKDFTDVRDMVKGYWLALDKGEPGKVYNICSERAIQIKGLLNHLIELSSRKVEIMKDPKRMRPSDNPILQGDSSKFRRRSGWKSEILLDKTLKDILEYWRKVL
jgi:GDP-4-dehydro-6-deoxy-D-mannose reductase